MGVVEGLLVCEFLSMSHLTGPAMHACMERAIASANAGAHDQLAVLGPSAASVSVLAAVGQQQQGAV